MAGPQHDMHQGHTKRMHKEDEAERRQPQVHGQRGKAIGLAQWRQPVRTAGPGIGTVYGPERPVEFPAPGGTGMAWT
eukprot:11631250-Heterocapsa_arctica.AAC.1